MTLTFLSLVLAMSGQAAPPPQQPPPTAAPAIVQKAPPAPRKMYNETADAKAQIEAAVASAAVDDIRVLLNWGANDDEACTRYQQVQRAPEVSSKFRDDYKLVYIDVGHLDKNIDLARSFGVTLASGGLPHFTILDAKGKVLGQLSARNLASDADAAVFDAKKMGAFLTTHQAPAPPPAGPVFEAALARAGREGTQVFVWFAAPW